VAFERVDVGRPELPERGEPGIHFHEGFGPEAIDAALRVDPRLHEACLPQHAEVFGHRRLGHPELALELPDGPLRRGQKLEHGAPARFRDDGEGRFHGRIFPQTYMRVKAF